MKYIFYLIIFFIYSCKSSDSQKKNDKSDQWVITDSLFNEVAKYYCDCISTDTAKWITDRNTTCMENIYDKFNVEFNKIGYDSLDNLKDSKSKIEEINSFIFSRVPDFCSYSYENINGIEKNCAVFNGNLLVPQEEKDGEYRITLTLINFNKIKVLYSDANLNLDFKNLEGAHKPEYYIFSCEEFERFGKREHKIISYFPFYDLSK